MILEFDLGNTSCKWRLLGQASQRLNGGRLDARVSEEVERLMATIPEPLSDVRISSVATAEQSAELADSIEAAVGLVPRFAETVAECAGLKNSYAEPSRMGVDRWLAMLAAFHEYRGNVLVVDAGSALTLDMVAADGRHLGGYIVPGPRLMAQSLLADTGQVRFHEADSGRWQDPGTSTAEAVTRGAKLALCGAVQQGWRLARQRFAGDVAVFLAGGYSTLLADELDDGQIDLRLRAELVMDGLSIALGERGD